MDKSGLVMKIEKKAAVIMTPTGKFYNVEIGKLSPKIGQEFNGKVKSSKNFYRGYVAAATLCFVLLTGVGAYAYYVPTTTTVIDINPSIELKSNMLGKIVSYRALNEDGQKVLSEINIKHKTLSEGLNTIVKECVEDKFIESEEVDSENTINVSIVSQNNKPVDLSDFENNINGSDLNVKINNSGVKKEIKSVKDKSKEEQNSSQPKSNIEQNKSDDKLDKNNKNEKKNNNTDIKNEENKGNDKSKKQDGKDTGETATANTNAYEDTPNDKLNKDKKSDNTKKEKSAAGKNDSKIKSNSSSEANKSKGKSNNN